MFKKSTSPAQTQKMGEVLAKKGPKNSSFVLGLVGDLGGGKTTFLQGFARGLGIKEKITSPTFVILKRFKIDNSRFGNFYHLDCYRVSGPRDILRLGWEKIIADSKNVVAVEWADRIRKNMPQKTFWLHFKFLGKNKRMICLRKKD